MIYKSRYFNNIIKYIFLIHAGFVVKTGRKISIIDKIKKLLLREKIKKACDVQAWS